MAFPLSAFKKAVERRVSKNDVSIHHSFLTVQCVYISFQNKGDFLEPAGQGKCRLGALLLTDS